MYQKHNLARVGFHPLQAIQAELPFEHISKNLFGPLTTTLSGYNYVLVVVDIATCFVLLKPLRDKTAEETAWNLAQCFTDFGVPKILQSDNGTEFANRVLFELKSQLGFDHCLEG